MRHAPALSLLSRSRSRARARARYAVERLALDPAAALHEFEAKRESMRGRPRCRAYALRGLPETDEARLAAAAAEVASPVFGGRLIAVAMPTETDPVPLWRATADAANVRIAGVLSLRNHTAPFRHKSGLKGPKPDALQAAIRENGWEVGHVPAPYQPWQPMTRQTYAKCLAFVERCRRAAPPEAAEAAEEGEAAAAIKPPAVVVCCTRDMYLSGAFAVRYAIEELGYELADATQEFEEATPWRSIIAKHRISATWRALRRAIKYSAQRRGRAAAAAGAAAVGSERRRAPPPKPPQAAARGSDAAGPAKAQPRRARAGAKPARSASAKKAAAAKPRAASKTES